MTKVTDSFRVWLNDESGADRARVFTDTDEVKRYIVDSVHAGHDVYTDFAYIVNDGFADPATIEIVAGDWRDRLAHEVSAARERAQERTPDE